MNEFYEKLSKHNNYMDPASLQKVYYSLLKLILDEVRRGKEIELPDFGKFKILEQKERKIRNVNTGNIDIVKPTQIIKFYPSKKLKEHIKNVELKK